MKAPGNRCRRLPFSPFSPSSILRGESSIRPIQLQSLTVPHSQNARAPGKFHGTSGTTIGRQGPLKMKTLTPRPARTRSRIGAHSSMGSQQAHRQLFLLSALELFRSVILAEVRPPLLCLMLLMDAPRGISGCTPRARFSFKTATANAWTLRDGSLQPDS